MGRNAPEPYRVKEMITPNGCAGGAHGAFREGHGRSRAHVGHGRCARQRRRDCPPRPPGTGRSAAVLRDGQGGPATCALSGYPQVVLYDDTGAALPFRYVQGGGAYATAIRLTLPAAYGAAFAGREAVGIAGPAGLSYCRGGRRDPGQVVAVSPVE